MALKRRKDTPPRRSPADLPTNTDDLTPQTADAIVAGEETEEALIIGGDLSGRQLPSLIARYTIFQAISFAGTEIPAPRLRDVRFVNCDLSNANWRGFEATRVEFIDCRLMGMAASECRWHDVLLERCEASYIRLNDCRMSTCEFRASNLSEADLHGTDLEGAIFDKVLLKKADLGHSRLYGADLRGAEIDGIVVFPEDVRGAVVNAAQAMDLARLLGVVIK